MIKKCLTEKIDCVLKILGLCIGGSAVGSSSKNGFDVSVRRGSGVLTKQDFTLTKNMISYLTLIGQGDNMVVLTYPMEPTFLMVMKPTFLMVDCRFLV